MANNIRTANGVRYRFVGEYGSIRMENAKTINRYLELKAEQPKSDDYGMFFAFSNEQLEEGRKRLIDQGYMKEGEKVCSAGMGMFGTSGEISRYLNFYKEREEKQRKECNPQEVYFYEWNNHECMVSGNDDDALKIIIGLFGNEAAHKIKRVYPGTATNILAPLTERDRHLGEYDDTLMMLSRMKFDLQGFFSERDCRYHRPEDLWAGCVNGEILKTRELYHQLPDDIKDASPMTLKEIEDYAERLDDWACEEFAKPEYDPHPRTKREDLPKEIYLGEKLYYKDDDGNWQTPDRIWFSHDSRRWHKDGRKVHGLAYTSYLGKHGTTLAPVYEMTYGGRKQLRREDLCDVSCKYSYTPWIKGVGVGSRCYDFYYE